MPGYDVLIKELETLKSNVAIFRKVVLHSHSPQSYDYKGKKSEEEYIDKLKASKLNMLAITDHMKCDLACRLSNTKMPQNTCILPGLEINIRQAPPNDANSLHILAIFPEKYSLEQVWRIIPPEIKSEKKCKGDEELNNVVLSDFVKNVHDNNGLCIAAHIYNKKGAQKTFKQLGRDGIVLFDPNYQLTKEDDRESVEKVKNWLLTVKFDVIEV